MQGYLELLAAMDDAPSEMRRSFLSKAQRACDELVLLQANIMDASRIKFDAGSLVLRDLPLNETVEQYQKVLAHAASTHCSYGKPYGPNCGGLYPWATAVGTTCAHPAFAGCASHGVHEACESHEEHDAGLSQEAGFCLPTSPHPSTSVLETVRTVKGGHHAWMTTHVYI